jgi:hypothetical protein
MLARRVVFLSSPYCSEARALFAAMTTTPTAPRKAIINTAIVALKASGVWARLDGLYVLAAADSQAAKLNWRAPSTFVATEVSAPAFVADRGFTGDADPSYVETGFNPTTAGGQFVLDSNHMGIWPITNVAEANSQECGNANSTILSRSATDTASGRNSQTSTNTLATGITDSRNYYLTSRGSSSGYDWYIGATAGSIVQVSSALSNLSFWACCRNNAGVSTRQQSLFHFGAALTAGQAAAARAAFSAYLTAVGAI